jgi:2-polyprenyl-3-methyl-5-hydroxy-6-metoxy-1,4-benzoquinol methylase
MAKPSGPITTGSRPSVSSRRAMPADAIRPRPEFAATFERVARRYRDCGRFARAYVAGKLRRDPVHQDVLALAADEAFGEVVDIGCGRGQLAVALLEAGLARSVLGLDRNAGHLGQACRAATGLAFASALWDLTEARDVPEATTVMLVDVLYQLEAGVQLALLRTAARVARQRILIRALDPDRGMRSALTIRLERLMRLVCPHSGKHVDVLPVARLTETLSEAGFAVSVAPCWQGTPFANVLIIGRRAS